jgi:hypothetical protein
VTAHNTTRSLFFPFCGGIESRVGELYEWSGWMEPARVVARAADSVTVSIRTADGFQLTRTVSLAPAASRLAVRSVLTNPGEKPRPARLRTHLELDLGDLRRTRVRFRDLSGRKVERDGGRVIAGLRRGEVLRARDLPDGAWTFAGPRGPRVVVRFPPEEIDFAALCAYPEEQGEMEAELWGKPALLAPGQALAAEMDIELESSGSKR